MNLILEWWWNRQRAMDLAWLWPQCKRIAPSMDEAHQMFMLHAMNERCWLNRYGEQLWDEVQKLH